MLDEKDVEKGISMLLRAQKLKTTGVAAHREVEKLHGRANYLLGIESIRQLCGEVLRRAQGEMTVAKEKGHKRAGQWTVFLEKLGTECRDLARETDVNIEDAPSESD